MDAQTFLSNFGTIAKAPGGVNRLRELILDLAVRGKLLPQDSADEPSELLLRRIADRREQLEKIGRLGKAKRLDPIRDRDIPFAIPDGWAYERLGNIVEVVRGLTFPASAKQSAPGDGLVACLRTANVQDEIDWDDLIWVDASYVKDDRQFMRKDDILMSTANSRALVGKVALNKSDVTGVSFGGFVTVIRPIELVPAFLMAVFRQPATKERLINSSTQTTNIANISMGRLRPLVLGVPPMAEQERIVAKVDELMQLCDELEVRQQATATVTTRFRASALDALMNAETDTDLATAWTRVQDNWETLTDHPDSVDYIRQTVLHLAVRGKLARQNPADEPAALFLEAVATERARLVQTAAIRQAKDCRAIRRGETPFKIPRGWAVARLCEIASLQSGTTVAAATVTPDGGVPYVKVADMSLPANDRSITTSSRFVARDSVRPNNLIRSGAILFPKRGGAIATNKKKVADVDVIADSNIMSIRPVPPLSLEYLELWLAGVDLAGLSSGTSVPQINNKDLYPLVVALPPLAEQHRIRATVDSLFQICDELEGRLVERSIKAEHVAASVVHHLSQ